MSVPFCNSKAFKIDSPELYEKVFLECEKIFNLKLKRGYFPGPQPVAIENKDITGIQNGGYMVCEKTDGERAILLLINIDNKPMCFIINRNNELYFMDLLFKKEVFEGSIFDGEIIKTKKDTWNYVIHDCMSYNGVSFLEQSHRLRYSCIIDFIVKRYVNKPTDCFNVKTKIFYKFGNQLNKTWDHIKKTTENKIDGLVFTPVDHPIVFGRDNKLFKWKQEHTIDFFIKRENKKINLYGTRKGEMYIFKTLDKKNEKIIEDFVTKPKLKKGCIVECKIDDGLYIAYRIRDDKSQPNSELTIKNTLINIEEAITITDLIQLGLNMENLKI